MDDKKPSLAMFTDLYQLTMAQAYWRIGTTAQATFSLYFRSYPRDRAYFVLGGTQSAIEHLAGFHFSVDDIDSLRSLALFDDGFLDYLGRLRFTGSVRAMAEGSIFFAREPVIEVTAPIIEAQLLETYLINQINLNCILATKASRVEYAARGKTVVDFGARRTQGIDAANALARVGYMVGFAGTSNVMAGTIYGIPTFGTMAHSFVESLPKEIDAFVAYAETFPESSTLLVDTYDTLGGVRAAIVVAREMRRRGHDLRAIRLDSGDLMDLSTGARALLDKAGLNEVQVFASGGLDEFEVDALVRGGAAIDGFGVGTKVGVSADAPWTDCAYKLVEYDGRPTLKLSAGKRTLPGPKQVYRYVDDSGGYLRNVIARADERPTDAGAEPLLEETMSGGKPLGRPRSLEGLRARFKREFGRLPEMYKALRSPATYQVSTSEALERLRATVSRDIGRRHRPSDEP